MAKKSPFDKKVAEAMQELRDSDALSNIFHNIDEAIDGAAESISLDADDPDFDEVILQVNRLVLEEYQKDRTW